MIMGLPRSGTACDCECSSDPRSGNKTERGVEFRHSTYNECLRNESESPPRAPAPAGKLARVSPERPEPASSTTGAPPPPPRAAPPADWSVEDVIGFIAAADHALAAHADLFRKHEIDGKALLLLNSDMMMKYMGLKLGPALKICNLVSKIKNRRHYST